MFIRQSGISRNHTPRHVIAVSPGIVHTSITLLVAKLSTKIHTRGRQLNRYLNWLMEVRDGEASSSRPKRDSLTYIPDTPFNASPQVPFKYSSVAKQDPVICIDNGISYSDNHLSSQCLYHQVLIPGELVSRPWPHLISIVSMLYRGIKNGNKDGIPCCSGKIQKRTRMRDQMPGRCSTGTC